MAHIQKATQVAHKSPIYSNTKYSGNVTTLLDISVYTESLNKYVNPLVIDNMYISTYISIHHIHQYIHKYKNQKDKV